MAGPRRLSNETRSLDLTNDGGSLHMDVQFPVLLSWSAQTSIPLYLGFSFLDLFEWA